MLFRNLDLIKKDVSKLLYGRTPHSTVFTHVLLLLNISIILISIFALFNDISDTLHKIEFAFGVIFLVEYLLRFWVSRHKFDFNLRFVNIIDLLIIISLLLVPFVNNLAFLKILRVVQLARAYKFFGTRFNPYNNFINHNLEIVTAGTHVLIFLFLMSALVYFNQVNINNQINNYTDALYFTVASVTTTGFGDIVPVGSLGRILSIIIMLLGVTLFFRLMKSMVISNKLYSTCQNCGQGTHEKHAHYCNICGHKIKNKYVAPDEKQDFCFSQPTYSSLYNFKCVNSSS